MQEKRFLNIFAKLYNKISCKRALQKSLLMKLLIYNHFSLDLCENVRIHLFIVKKNISNDFKNKKILEELGYQVIIIWECEINKKFDETLKKIVSVLGPPHRKMQ